MRFWIALAIACAAAPALADDTADIKAMSNAFVKAWDAGDAKAIAAMYAEDARVVWPGQGDEAKGRAAIEALVARTIKMFPKSGLVLKSNEATPLGRDYVANVADWEQTVTGADGSPAVVHIRATEVLKRQGGKLVYVLDHASAGLPAPPSH